MISIICFVVKVALMGLEPSYDDGQILGDVDSAREVSVLVQIGGFILDTMGLSNFDPNGIFETCNHMCSSIYPCRMFNCRPK